MAWVRESVASVVRAAISPPKICWHPAHAVPTMLRDRTVIPQQGPTTCAISEPGGASNVVRIGILCGVGCMSGPPVGVTLTERRGRSSTLVKPRGKKGDAEDDLGRLPDWSGKCCGLGAPDHAVDRGAFDVGG